MQAPTPNAYQAYQRATHTVAKTRQVVMLYDGAIRFLQQAKAAMEAHDISERYTKLARAGDVVSGLQSCLDFEQGGGTAQILYDFYSAIEMRVLALHRTNDAAECEAIIGDLKQMRDVWHRIDRGSDDKAIPAVAPAPELAADTKPQQTIDIASLTVSA